MVLEAEAPDLHLAALLPSCASHARRASQPTRTAPCLMNPAVLCLLLHRFHVAPDAVSLPAAFEPEHHRAVGPELPDEPPDDVRRRRVSEALDVVEDEAIFKAVATK